MKKLFRKSHVTNLSAQIKTVIGYRILLCFFLALSVVLTITIIEISSSSHQLEKNIDDQCKALESFVVSQFLINNEEAIQPKLDSINQKRRTINIRFTSNTSNSEKLQQLHWNFPVSWIYLYPITNLDGTKIGTFNITGSLLDDHGLFSDLFKKIALLMLFFIIIFIVLYPLSRRIPQQLFITPINNLLVLLRNEKNQLTCDNFSNIPKEINEIKDKISNLLTDAKKRSHDVALGKIAMQVAHDIRSPLFVLNLETEGLFSIPEKKRIAIRDAIQRVNDIANNLLSRYKQDKDITYNEIIFNSEPLTIMLESIVSEKRVEVSNTSIKIDLEKCSDADTLFIKVDIAGFKRVFSNIINNSIEAIKNSGIITIKLSNNCGTVIISVTDNGCGIPKHQLPLILESGVSFGKPQGSGLGLPYIIDKIYSWNGNYTITSEINEGTTFEIILPQARAATWFASTINIPQNWTVILLDDDELIHNIWNERFTNDFVIANNLKVLHFYTQEALEDYCKTKETSKTIFLLDYQLADDLKNGLVLAEKLCITKNSTLVTSRYEDTDIREMSQRIGMRILPKSFVMSVSIKIIKDIDLIFIDDDVSMTDIWKHRAESSGKKIDIFNNIYDFMHIFNLYKKNTLIYIDSALGGDLKGEDFAKILYTHEYQNLILCTGYNKERFKNIYWVKDILDKYPPF